MPKRYDNPQEILKIMRQTELLRQSAERSPFTGILTLFCYTLWKDYKYSQTKLSDFCGKFIEYNEKYENEPYTELQSSLNDFADWTIEYKEFTETDFPHYKSVVAQKCIREQVRCNSVFFISFSVFLEIIFTYYRIPVPFPLVADTSCCKRYIFNACIIRIRIVVYPCNIDRNIIFRQSLAYWNPHRLILQGGDCHL
jgi:hypothetical protein